MAKYTTQLNDILKSGYSLGLLEYPIFDEEYRFTLNNKILNHYKFMEIAYETAGMFKDRLNERMAYIMPLYNQFYSMAVNQANPLYTVNTTETYNNRTSSVSESDSENSTTVDGTTGTSGKSIHSDTPQGMLSAASIDADTYASDASLSDMETTNHDTNSGTTSASSTASNTNEYIRNVVGISAGVSNAELQARARDSMVNLDALVIEELKDLFFLLW